MSQTSFETAYDPTRSEIRRELQLAYRAIQAGLWRVAWFTSSFWRGGAFATAGFVLAFIVMGWFGATPSVQTGLYYGLVIFIAVLPLALQRALALRYVDVYRAAPIQQGQRLRFDPRGIHLDNGRSHSHVDWRDVSQVIAAKGMVVAVHANQGLVIPDRLFAAQGCDPDEMHDTMRDWHAAAWAGGQ